VGDEVNNVAAAKCDAHRIIDALPSDQRAAMDAMTYVPYLVGAVGASEPLASGIALARTLDTPMATIRQVGSTDQAHLLRFELPLRPGDRRVPLDAERLRTFGREVTAHLDRLFPGAREKLEEMVFVNVPDIQLTTLGDDIVVMGALASALTGGTGDPRRA
jgi:hypothetical protein